MKEEIKSPVVMEKFFEASATSLLAICLSALGIYLGIILFTRIAGKRSFSKMSSFDFAMTISIGAIIATTVLSPSVSLLQGITGLGMIYLLEIISTSLRQFYFYRRLVDSPPLLLMNGENILDENLHKARVTKAELRAVLRKANVLNLSQVRAVVFESTGEVSVLHSSRYEENIEEWLLKDVKP